MADYRGKQGGSTSVVHPCPVTEINHRFNKRGRDTRRDAPQKHSCLQTTENLTLLQSAATILISIKQLGGRSFKVSPFFRTVMAPFCTLSRFEYHTQQGTGQVSSSGKAADLRSGGTWFESQSERLS
jgi:hypothetical protein